MRPRGSPATALVGGWTAGAAAFLLALGPSMIVPSAADPTGGHAPGHLLPNVGGLGLVVDPSSWWLTSGNRTQIAATWAGIPPGCLADPLWFRWALATGFAEGTLEPSDGPSVNFTAGFAESGTAEVEVRSTVVVTCGTSEESTYDAAGSTVTVVAPLRLENLSLSPDLVTTGTLSDLSGLLVGGDPPYEVRVGWGDGNVTLTEVAAPGPFSIAHRFPSGTFFPSLVASDAAGLTTNGTVDGPLSASTGFAVGLSSPTVAAEVGVPIRFSEEILDPPAEYDSVTQCTDAPSDRPSESSTNLSVQNFTCTFALPGSAEVDFEVIPVDYDQPVEEVSWSEPVAPSLALNVSPPAVMAEVGLPTVFTVRLSGGVPPFLITWQLGGNATFSTELAYADGSVELPVWPSEPGSYALRVEVRDALGVFVADGTAALPVDAPLNVSTASSRILELNGAVVRVAGTVSQGTAPFLWWVLPGITPIAESAPNGTLPSIASFSWNGTLAQEGNSTVSIVVVDGAGAVAWETMPMPLVPVLHAAAQATPVAVASGPVVLLNLSVSGGLPPFDLGIASSGWVGWNRSLPADGVYSFSFAPNESGSVNLVLTLRDQLGAEWIANLSVDLPPSTPPSNGSAPPENATSPPSASRPPANVSSTAPPSNGESGLLDLVVVLGACAGVGVLLWRRRHRPTPSPTTAVDPVEVLRRILEPADGAERSTVELLAEEAGVPLEKVHLTIDRLVSEGSIRSESGPDGEEVLAWSPADRS